MLWEVELSRVTVWETLHARKQINKQTHSKKHIVFVYLGFSTVKSRFAPGSVLC